MSVRRLASFVVVFILLSTDAPLLACMTGKAMHDEESGCCRSMRGNCGDMTKMGFCKTEVKADQSPRLATAAPATDVHFEVVAWLAPQLSSFGTIPPSLFRLRIQHAMRLPEPAGSASAWDTAATKIRSFIPAPNGAGLRPPPSDTRRGAASRIRAILHALR